MKDGCLSSRAINTPAISDSSEPTRRSTCGDLVVDHDDRHRCGKFATTLQKDVPLSLVTTTKTRTFSLTATDLPLPKRRHYPEKCQVLRARPLALRYSQGIEASLRSDLACRS